MWGEVAEDLNLNLLDWITPTSVGRSTEVPENVIHFKGLPPPVWGEVIRYGPHLKLGWDYPHQCGEKLNLSGIQSWNGRITPTSVGRR